MIESFCPQYISVQLFTKRQNFRPVQIQSIYRQQNKCDQKTEFVSGGVKNIVGKGENAGNQHFLLSPKCFQKAPFPGSLKVGIVCRELSTLCRTAAQCL